MFMPGAVKHSSLPRPEKHRADISLIRNSYLLPVVPNTSNTVINTPRGKIRQNWYQPCRVNIGIILYLCSLLLLTVRLDSYIKLGYIHNIYFEVYNSDRYK